MLNKKTFYTKKLSEVGVKDVEIVGRNAVWYSKIYHSGVRMNKAFVITTQAFDDYILSTNLVDPIVEILKSVKPFYYDTAVDASRRIANLLLNVDIPDFIFESIAKEFITFQEKKSLGLAKLSVSHFIADEYIPEDEKDIVFGNIYNLETLHNEIKEAWKTLFSPKAIESRTNNYFTDAITAALVLQRIPKPEISGKIFSFDTEDNKENEIKIHAILGIENGDSDIKNMEDKYKVNIERMEITERTIMSKEYMYLRKGAITNFEDDVVKVVVSPDWKKKQVINDNQILEVTNALLKLEKEFNSPLEIDWVIEGGNLFVLDAKIMQKPEVIETKKQEEQFEVKEEDKPTTIVKKKPNIEQLRKEIINSIEDNAEPQEKKMDLINPLKVKVSDEHDEESEATSNNNFYIDLNEINTNTNRILELYKGIHIDGADLFCNYKVLPDQILDSKIKLNDLKETLTLDLTTLFKNASNKDIFFQFSNMSENDYKKMSSNLEIITTDERFLKFPKALEFEWNCLVSALNESQKQEISVILPSTRSLDNAYSLKKILLNSNFKRTNNRSLYLNLAYPSMLNDLLDIQRTDFDGIVIEYDNLVRFSVHREFIRESDNRMMLKILLPLIERLKENDEKVTIKFNFFDNQLVKDLENKVDGFIFLNRLNRNDWTQIN